MRTRVLVVAAAAAVTLAATAVALLVAGPPGTRTSVGHHRPVRTSAAPVTAAPVTAAPDPVVDTPGYWSWALLDRATGELTGGADGAGTNTTESMIKVWLVADALRRHTEAGGEPSEELLVLASRAIRDSDDAAAQTLYLEGGGDEVVHRLIDMCGLVDTTIYPDWWSRTEMSARDAVRMGLCIAGGRGAGPRWTEWLLAEMRQVRGSVDPADQPYGGRWGIIDAVPAGQADRIAIKNGWTAILADASWHVNCLAIADEWILVVQARYPVELGLDHGAGLCRDVARQVLLVPRS